MKKYKAIDILWAISLIIISIVTLTLSIVSIVGCNLPDVARRLLGIVDIIALIVFVFTTARKYICRRKSEK